MKTTIAILVVDDEQIVLDSIKKLLRKTPYIVHTALNVQDALLLLQKTPIDIVLTDLMMPEIDGLEFMRMIKQERPHLPIIMITGYATINTALQATQLGAFDYVAKPFTRKELHSVLKRASELVQTTGSVDTVTDDKQTSEIQDSKIQGFKSIGDNSWIVLEEEGTVLVGIDHDFLHAVGTIQTIYLPAVGDELRQGSSFLQIISTDLQSHTVLAPLSGTVVAVNQHIAENPTTALQDPHSKGWVIRLKPSRFDLEIQELGL